MALLGISILIASLSYLIYKRLVPYNKLIPLRGSDEPRTLDPSNAQRTPIIITDDEQIQEKPTEKEKQEDEDRKIMPPPALPPLTRRISPNTGKRRENGPSSSSSPSGASSMKRTTAHSLPLPQPPSSSSSPPTTSIPPASPRHPPNTPAAPKPRFTLQPPTRSGPSTLLSTSTPTPPPKRRKPVVLSPGHSPLDWARLQQDPNVNLRGTTHAIPVPPSLLARHNRRDDAWAAFGGRVYNITPYLEFHPGGVAELMRAAGRDGSGLFAEVHPWVSWETMLRACEVGVLVDEPVQGEGGGWEEMD